jgi:maltodextrin utilization protein YvdJ
MRRFRPFAVRSNATELSNAPMRVVTVMKFGPQLIFLSALFLITPIAVNLAFPLSSLFPNLITPEPDKASETVDQVLDAMAGELHDLGEASARRSSGEPLHLRHRAVP